MHIVKYIYFLEIEHKDKILAPKWDSSQKNVVWRKAERPMKWVKKGEWYIINDCKHRKNQAAYVSKRSYLFCNKFIMGWLVRSARN